MGSSTVAGGVEIPTGRNGSAYGGGDARSWALAGGTVGLFGREVPEMLPRRSRREPILTGRPPGTGCSRPGRAIVVVDFCASSQGGDWFLVRFATTLKVYRR